MNNTVKNKEKLQNTKKIKDIVKKFSVISLSLILSLLSFNFSFADDSFSLPVGDSTTPESSIVVYLSGTNTRAFNSSRSSVYVFSVGNSSSYSFYFATNSNEGFTSYRFDNGLYSNISYSYSTLNDFSYSSSYDLYYTSFASFSGVTSAVNNYSDITSALSSLREYINSSNTPIAKYPYTFLNGYLFVYDLGNSSAMYSFDLTSKSEEYSNLGDYPFPDTNQSFWFSNSLPEIDETNIPDSNATIIHWLKGDKQNIFGQTQDMIATISGTSSGRYLYIYNPPAHYNWVGNSNPTASETINYPVTINGVSSGDNFYIYDSVARLADYNQGGKVQGTVGEVGYGSVASDGAITVTSSDGAIYNQVSGGSTDISGANGGSIAENINGLKQTLDDFVNQFIQLLSAPISHIQQLIQSSHQFFDVFSQLFEWLPSELSSVIISGLIIMVVIGVIKMLL